MNIEGKSRRAAKVEAVGSEVSSTARSLLYKHLHSSIGDVIGRAGVLLGQHHAKGNVSYAGGRSKGLALDS